MPEPELFPDKPDPEQREEDVDDESDVKDNVTTLGSRLRVLEEQYSNLRNKAQLAETNLLEFQQDVRDELKSLTQDVVDVKHDVKELREKITRIDNQISDSVEEHELKKLENYLDLWNPSDFVTYEELDDALDSVSDTS